MNRQDSNPDPATSSQIWRKLMLYFATPHCLLETTRHRLQRIGAYGLLVVLVSFPSSTVFGQDSLPFEVSNPKNKRWPAIEASRIYFSACELVAREVRPERPPRLRPKFRMVLGADADQVVQKNGVSEIQLKSWDSEHFAQGVVFLAARDILKNETIGKLAHHALASTQATVSLTELRDSQ